jgi:hypothetical protein
MRKTLLAVLILSAGAIASARFSFRAHQSRTAAAESRAECVRLTSRLAELKASTSGLRGKVKAQKHQITEAQIARSSSAYLPKTGEKAAQRSRHERPSELLQRLGVGWNSSPDYVLVSKGALKEMYLPGIDDKGAFTPTACAILGLTAAERGAIEDALKRAETKYDDWVKTAVQRVEPTGDIVADYRLPANPALAQQIETNGVGLVLQTLGPERASLIRGYDGAWLFGHGNLGATPIRFTVRRHPEGGQPPYWWQIQAGGGNSASSDGLSSKDFPDAFRPVFPDGWRDLAQREGFELPEGFQ